MLDLTRVLAGPFCTMILGDLGADIIKIEGTGIRDETREWGPPFIGGESAYYLCANRNKQAMTLNLKTDEGKTIFKELAARADVVVENFKAGTMARLGLGYEVLRQVNPQLIYASITGFGATGSNKDEPGYDFIIQAMSGLMSITGDKTSGPLKVGVAISDVLTGLYTAIGILAALKERDRSGMGQQIDISLFDSQVSALVNVASNYLVSGEIPEPLGNQHPNIVPYQLFPTADLDLVVAVGNDRQFARFAEILGLPELSADEKFATNAKRVEHREELVSIINEVMRQKPAKHWQKLLQQAKIPHGPVNNIQTLFADPLVRERQMVVEMAHPTAGLVTLVGSPLKLSRTPVEMRRHPPLYGEHTEQILLRLGYTKEQVKEMKEKQII